MAVAVLDEQSLAEMNPRYAEQIRQQMGNIPATKFIVRLYKRFNFNEFYMASKKTFCSLEEARTYLRYVSFEKFRTYDKGDIIDNNGVIHNEQYI